MVLFFDMWMKLTANNTASLGAVACIEANGFWICSWKNVTSSIILGSWGQSSLEALYPPPERCLQSFLSFQATSDRNPPSTEDALNTFFVIYYRSTRKKTVTRVISWRVNRWDLRKGFLLTSVLCKPLLSIGRPCLTGIHWRNCAYFQSVQFFALHACALPFTFPPNHLLSPLFTSCCSPWSNIDRGQWQSKVTPSQFLMYNIAPQMVFPLL